MTDRTEEQERVEREAHRALEDPDEWDALLEIVGEELPETWRKYADDADSPEEAGACAGAARDMEVAVLLLTRLREQKDELERAAREARKYMAHQPTCPYKAGGGRDCECGLYEARDRMSAALEDADEREGRGGGEAEQKLERVADLLEHVDGAIGDSGQATYWLREAHRHVGDLLARPDPSEGEVGCDHENTVLDDNVEWCPDCRRVMPEDAEDDGREEGQYPEVERFAELMADRLYVNRHRGTSWKDETDEWLLNRLREEVRELAEALPGRGFTTEQERKAIANEAADVANFTMMIADNVLRHSGGGGLAGTVEGRYVAHEADRPAHSDADESEGRGGGGGMTEGPHHRETDWMEHPDCTCPAWIGPNCPVHAEDAEDDGRGEGWTLLDDLRRAEKRIEKRNHLIRQMRSAIEALFDGEGEYAGSVADSILSAVKETKSELGQEVVKGHLERLHYSMDLFNRPAHSDADPELGHDVEDVRQQSDEELVDALESLARNFCLEAGLGYAPVNLAGLEIKRRLQNRSDADPSGVDPKDYDSIAVVLNNIRHLPDSVHPEIRDKALFAAEQALRRFSRRTENAGEEVEGRE